MPPRRKRPAARGGRGKSSDVPQPKITPRAKPHTTPPGFKATEDPTVHASRGARLIAESGSRDGNHYPIGTSITVGRGLECGVTLDDHGVSRRHATITLGDSGENSLEDLNSRNGTMLNGKLVERALLSFGDKIKIGSHVLLFTRYDVEEQELLQRTRLEMLADWPPASPMTSTTCSVR